jgi:hypothetical protein
MSSAEETNALTRVSFLQEQLVVCYLFCPQFGENLPLREREIDPPFTGKNSQKKEHGNKN